MQERLQSILNNFTNKWNELEKQQKTRIIAIVFVLIVSLGITIYLMTRPDWVVLADKRSQSEISQLQTALNDLGYKHKLGSDGTSIMVLSKDLTQSKVSLSTTEIATEGAFTFQDAMDFSGMGSTEMVKKASFKHLAETELAKTILNYEGIESATVRLAIPETNSYFIENPEKPSAGIQVHTSNQLAKGSAEAIARLVASSVVGLEIGNIEITDQTMKSLYSGMKNEEDSLSAEKELMTQRKRELEGKIESSLKPLFDDVQIVSNLVFDWDKSKSIEKSYEPPVEDSSVGVPRISKKENQKVINSDNTEEMGVGANDNQTAEYQIGDGTTSTANIKNNEDEYLYNEKEEIIEKGIGTFRPEESSMLISAYRFKNVYQTSVEQSGNLQGQSWDEYKANLESKKIDIEDDLVEKIAKGIGIENVSVIGYEVPIFVDEIIPEADAKYLPILIVLIALILLLAYGIFRSTPQEEIEVIEIEPELDVEELLLSTKIEEAKMEELAKLEEIEIAKDSETKKQIEKFINERPEAAAQLLRNWIAEDWK